MNTATQKYKELKDTFRRNGLAFEDVEFVDARENLSRNALWYRLSDTIALTARITRV